MSMTILNNPSAMMTLGQLNKNINKAGKDLKKVSSGMKINSAGDDSSAYSISERMRAQIRSLRQDIDNVKNGRSLLKVAAGGIDNIVDELRNLKELALNAANDTNTDVDRATIQKEFDQKMANINDIASETNYNGKILLDGRYGRTTSFGYEYFYTQNVPVTRPTASGGNIASGDTTISSNGVYTISAGYTGTITVNADNVELVGPGSSLSNVRIVTKSSGNTNLWINNLDITSSMSDGPIRFQGSNNTLNLVGTNNIETTNPNPSNDPLIDIGAGLTIQSATGTSGTLNATAGGWWSASPLIGPHCDNWGTADLTIASGTINASISSGDDTVIGYSSGGPNGTLTIGSDANVSANGTIGGGFDGDIIIASGAVINAQSVSGAAIGSSSGKTIENITIYSGATVSATSASGAAIGSGLASPLPLPISPGTVGDILIYSGSNISANSIYGAGIGSGGGGKAGDITIYTNGSTINAQSTDGDDIGAGVYMYQDATVGNVKILDAASAVDTPLIIHHGTKANQALNCYINDMRTDALGLSKTKVSTRDDAVWALSDDTTTPPRIGAIDAAIEYALDEATTIGSYISRLEFTEDNLVTANENTQASESTIRDADMAKEMTEYTRSNVLAQAAQSMLAQANQNSSSVLSLLQ